MYRHTPKFVALIFAAAVCLTLPSVVLAAQDEEKPGAKWWETGSLMDEMEEDRFLAHAEGKVSYDEMQGNVTGKEYDITAGLTARYWRLTNLLEYRLQRAEQEIEGGRGSLKVEVENFSEELRFDLLRHLYAAIGYNWTQDDVRFIDTRHTWFAGLGSDLTLGSSHVVNGAVYLGYEELRYTIPVERFESVGWMVQQGWKWQVHPGVRFVQDAFFLGFAEDSNRYRWRLSYGFVFPLSKHFGIMVNREIKYDNHPVGVALKKDKLLSVGLRFDI